MGEGVGQGAEFEVNGAAAVSGFASNFGTVGEVAAWVCGGMDFVESGPEGAKETQAGEFVFEGVAGAWGAAAVGAAGGFVGVEVMTDGLGLGSVGGPGEAEPGAGDVGAALGEGFAGELEGVPIEFAPGGSAVDGGAFVEVASAGVAIDAVGNAGVAHREFEV